MLDRLALGLVTLPSATYDLILVLTEINGSRSGSAQYLRNRMVMTQLVQALCGGGTLRVQDGTFTGLGGAEQTEAILAGLVHDGTGGMMKPDSTAAQQTVTLNFGKRKDRANAAAVPLNGLEAASSAKRKSGGISTGSGMLASTNGIVKATPAGVGFVDSTDDFEDGQGYAEDEDEDMEIPSNEELERAAKIDPDTLLTEEDRQRPIIIRESRVLHESFRFKTDSTLR